MTTNAPRSVSAHHERHDPERLRALFEDVIDPATHVDALTVPTWVWGDPYWDFMPEARRRDAILKMARVTVERASRTMPVYAQSRAYKDTTFRLDEWDDLLRLPILLKDAPSDAGVVGFRERIQHDAFMLRPSGLEKTGVYESGGTKGVPTPTYLTHEDLLIESTALAGRSFVYGGMRPGSRLYNFYNPAHKGGKLLEMTAGTLPCELVVTKRPEDGLDVCLDKIRRYGIDALACVQPPLAEGASNKGAGVTFLDLVGADHSLFGRDGPVKSAFITGFPIPDEVLALAADIGLDCFTGWGASEAIPGATSTAVGPHDRHCQGNMQHTLHAPHVLSVVKEESGELVWAKPGDEGILLLTTLARHGTTFLNYAIGDKATVGPTGCSCGRTTPIIHAIRRADNPQDLVMAGCRYS